MYKNYSSKPNSYYLVQSSTPHLFKSYNNAYLQCTGPSYTDCENSKCNEGCEKCYGSTNNNCLNDNSCVNNVCCNYDGLYYPIKNQINSCYKNESRSIGYYLNLSNSQFETCNDGSIKCYDSTNINCLSATGDRQSDIYTCVSVCESSCTYRTFNESSKRVKFSCFVENEIILKIKLKK